MADADATSDPIGPSTTTSPQTLNPLPVSDHRVPDPLPESGPVPSPAEEHIPAGNQTDPNDTVAPSLGNLVGVIKTADSGVEMETDPTRDTGGGDDKEKVGGGVIDSKSFVEITVLKGYEKSLVTEAKVVEEEHASLPSEGGVEMETDPTTDTGGGEDKEKGGGVAMDSKSIIEITVLKGSEKSLVTEVGVVEEEHASSQLEGEKMNVDASAVSISVREEIPTMGDQVEKKDCDPIGEAPTSGQNIMESAVSVLVEPGDKKTVERLVCEAGIGEKPVVGGRDGDLSFSQGVGEKKMMGSKASEGSNRDMEIARTGATSVDDNKEKIAGIPGTNIVASDNTEDQATSSPAIDMNTAIETGKEKIMDTKVSELGAFVVSNGSAPVDLGASIIVDEKKSDSVGIPAMGSSQPCLNQMPDNPDVVLVVSLDRNEKEIPKTSIPEMYVSPNSENQLLTGTSIDMNASLDVNDSIPAESDVHEVGGSQNENHISRSIAVDMDTSLSTGKVKIAKTCVSEVGAPVLSKSSPTTDLCSSIVVDEEKMFRADVSEKDFPRAAEIDAFTCSDEKVTVGSSIPEAGVSLLGEDQITGSSAEHLVMHDEKDQKQIAGTIVTGANVSLHTENHVARNLVEDLSRSLGTEANLDTGDDAIMVDASQPHDVHSNGSESKEMETDGGPCLFDENTEIDSIELPGSADEQTVEHMMVSFGNESVKRDHRASYSLPEEKNIEFSVSNFVWGKVRSHPWWPGKIFDPLDASELASKHKRKDSNLVAYFGDRTFAWCEVSQLKPFRTYFQQMEKQSTSEAFLHAVCCALEEFSRCLELGLTCTCIPEEKCTNIKYQRIDNAGIREGASSMGGTDVSLFEPDGLLDYIQELALFPLGGGDRLDLVIAKAQLTSFYRSKGYEKLPEYHACGIFITDYVDILPGRKPLNDTVDPVTPVSRAEKKAPPNLDSGEAKPKARDRSSTYHKRNKISEDDLLYKRKQKSLAKIMSETVPGLVNGGESSSERNSTGKSDSIPSGKKDKAVDSFSDDKVETRKRRFSSLSDTDFDTPTQAPKRSFKVGDCIRRIAGQLTGSPPIIKSSSEKLKKTAGPPILKSSSEKFKKTAVKVVSDGDKAVHISDSPHTPKDSQRRRIRIPKEYSSSDELLSQLCLAARDPLKGYSFLSTIISFFTDFRNSIHKKCSSSGKYNISIERTGSGKASRGKSSNSRMSSPETFELSDTKDSYWTDRVILGGTEEEQSDASHKRKRESQMQIPPKKRGRPSSKLPKSPHSSPDLDSDQKADEKPQLSDINPVVNDELSVEKQEGDTDDTGEGSSLTALILNFTEADSVPSEADLNKIFSQYGPLDESEVLRKSKRARVVFKRRSDAEVAFSSAGKFTIFGPALVSYRLRYMSSKRKTSRRATTHHKKSETSMDGTFPLLEKDDIMQAKDDSGVPGGN